MTTEKFGNYHNMLNNIEVASGVGNFRMAVVDRYLEYERSCRRNRIMTSQAIACHDCSEVGCVCCAMLSTLNFFSRNS